LKHPTAPEGYLPFTRIIEALYANADEWGLRLPPLLAQYLAEHRVDPADMVPFSEAAQRWGRNSDVRQLVTTHLGTQLASGTVRAAGVSPANGVFAWAPAAAWRMTQFRKVKTQFQTLGGHVPAIEAAFFGDNIYYPLRGSKFAFFPVMADRDLALAFGASTPPARPALVPEDYEQPRKAITPVQASPAPSPDAQKNRGGRPPAHDWEAFWIEVACWAAANDLIPEKQNRPGLRQHMLAWSATQWTQPPDASTVDKKLAALFARAARET